MITTAQATTKYGVPSKNPNYLTTLNLPYPMRLSWDTKVKVIYIVFRIVQQMCCTLLDT